LDSLETWVFRFKAPAFGGWKSLDFLGFSRPNRDFSMGYTGFSAKKISRALWTRRDGNRRDVRRRSWHAEARNCSWGEFRQVSDFLQDIVA
jgi:hypothetical protein